MLGELARARLTEVIESLRANASVTGAGSMFRVHLKSQPPIDYRSAFSDAQETDNIKFLVDYMFDHGFMMINTCSGALSTAMTESEIDSMAGTLGEGLVALAQRS